MKRIFVLNVQSGPKSSQEGAIEDTIVQSLPSAEFTVQKAENVDVALRRLVAWKPHVFIVCLETGESGFGWREFIPRMRGFVSDDLPSLLLLWEAAKVSEILSAMDLGADSCLPWTFRPEDLVVTVAAMCKLKELRDSLRRSNRRIEELNTYDELTGLLNMKTLYRKGEEEIVRSRRMGRPIAAAMLNLDGFSAVNQSYGFMAGSQTLQEVARRIQSVIRSSDIAARVGADEFILVFPETDLKTARDLVEKVKSAVQSTPFKSSRSSIRLTACVGVATLDTSQLQQKMSDLLHISSEALRQAKADGQNRLHVYSL